MYTHIYNHKLDQGALAPLTLLWTCHEPDVDNYVESRTRYIHIYIDTKSIEMNHAPQILLWICYELDVYNYYSHELHIYTFTVTNCAEANNVP